MLALVTAAVALVAGQTPVMTDYTATQISSGEAWRNISTIADETMRSNIGSRQNASCTYENAHVRQEWRALEPETRKNFTDAVTCLQNMPPTVMTAIEAPNYPGIKSRYDEYVATHINYTLNIHDTAVFFAWHRAFTHFMEQDLRNLCDYTGRMPYWNWAEDSVAPQNSPLFSGDEYSMGGNGEYVPGRNNTWLAQQNILYPPGTGGGCVTQGPFSNYTVNLGPLSLPNVDNVNTTYQYNPRCLQRDINPWFSEFYNTYYNLTSLVLEQIYVENFQSLAQGFDSDANKFGIHGGGHWQIGGSMSDFHSSPADPIFFIHHAMVDNVWTVWQNLDIYRRQDIIKGTNTLDCEEPQCSEMKLTDIIPFGFVAEDQIFGNLMDNFDGPFCYRYD